ncbi:MAG: molybdopterin-binding/glycosyltransferase family 2 protein [Pseudomonadota bacterium]
MRFGQVAVARAQGAILAHSTNIDGQRMRKGRVLSAADVAALKAAGLAEVIVARLEDGDLLEDAAAEMAAAALVAEPAEAGLHVQAPFTGRVNLYAARPGILRVDAAAVARFNGVDEAVTLATLPDYARVQPRDMLATVKILPFAVPGATVAAACAALGLAPVLTVHGRMRRRAGLVATRVPGMKDSVIEKGLGSVRDRLAALGLSVASEAVVAHEETALRGALEDAAHGPAQMLLILGGSATQDRGDVGPAALLAAGGRLDRFGMPVDPGNLLFLGVLGDTPVIGLPGCVRSPALNGADWVLERLVSDIPVDARDIAAMGVGGLLKEIPTRPQPRAARSRRENHAPKDTDGLADAAAPVTSQGLPAPSPAGEATAGQTPPPLVAALVLAAGAARRMHGRDKLLEEIDGQPLLRRVVARCRDSAVCAVHVVLPAQNEARRAALTGMKAALIENFEAAEGMASSIRNGIRSLGPEIDAVILVLADMPEIGPSHLDRLIASYDPDASREICRAVTASGRPGHPVLFGRRFFENLLHLEGDEGARAVIAAAEEFVVDVPGADEAAVVDLDTPEAWDAWRAARTGAGRRAVQR